MRHAEEVELLLEEMRRVLAFLGWDQDRWKSHARHVRQRIDSITHSPTPLPAQVKTALFEEGLRHTHYARLLFATTCSVCSHNGGMACLHLLRWLTRGSLGSGSK